MPSNTPTNGHNSNHGSLKHVVNHHGHGSRNVRPGSLLALIEDIDGSAGAGTVDSLNAPLAGDKITGVTIEVTSPFDGAATIELGNTATADLLFPVGTVDLSVVGIQSLDLDLEWPIGSVVRATIGGAPTTGSANIRTVYED